ncbi:hypothetical protein ES677_07835 [Bizionia gelidisalsuginis]|uniref:DUF4468 domain-containing protein n=2 Tax=Bizionia TaxID=283785 RepID=A0A8H2LGL9_9FLAO|nr:MULTISPECIES: hypothetical protein [Bizionia]TYB73887.1 hypothetical protein ES676_09085 [Bizionia saleffrena]TYC12850.1 hypothetical protein ES677_07835 [Bizionia gelidisalsuginis]
MKKIVIFAVLFLAMYSGYAQNNINNYKYVIVPNSYKFLNSANEYRLNELTKFLFEKYNFVTFMENDAFPDEVISNGCLALRANVLDDSGFFKTILKIELKNCKGDIVYTTLEGISREKDRAVAYNLALRGASKSLDGLNYSYAPDANQIIIPSETTRAQEQINSLKKEIETLREEKITGVETTETPQTNRNVLKKSVPLQTVIKATDSASLYAQEIPNGYRVVDETSMVVFTLWQSNLKDVFIVKDNNAIVYKEAGLWIYSSVVKGKTVSKIMSLHF